MEWLSDTGITFDTGIRGGAVVVVVYATIRYILKLYDVVIVRLEARRDEDAEDIEQLGRDLARERKKRISYQGKLGVAIYQLNLHGVPLPPELQDKDDEDDD